MRSLLFVPADSERKLAKGAAVGADALILDLEDAVAPDRKPAARAMATEYLKAARQQAQRPRLYVRINSLDTGMLEADLSVIAGAPDTILLPKAQGGEDVQRLALALDNAEQKNGLPLGATRITVLTTEVPISMLDMRSYVGSSTRLEGLTWGAEDLGAMMGVKSNRAADGRAWTSPFRLARDLCLVTAVAAGVAPIDTIFANFRDAEGLRIEAGEAARDGFTAKMAIHPDQVAVINAAFTPTPEEVAHAQAVVRVFADNPGAGALALDGQMLDRPHLVNAERILARAAARPA